LSVPAFIPYPETVPFRAVAAAVGLVLLPLVSRATMRLDPPRPLRNMAAAGAAVAEREGASRAT